MKKRCCIYSDKDRVSSTCGSSLLRNELQLQKHVGPLAGFSRRLLLLLSSLSAARLAFAAFALLRRIFDAYRLF